MDDSQPTPKRVQEDWWIAGLKLSSDDLERLLTGMELTDTIINAAQSILQRQFPGCSGFQDVTLGPLLSFCPVSGSAVQILHTGKLSNKVYIPFKLLTVTVIGSACNSRTNVHSYKIGIT